MITESEARKMANRLDREAERFLEDDEAAIANEPDLTSRLLERLRIAANGYRTNQVYWTAAVLNSMGPNTAERSYGADFAGVFRVSMPDMSLAKGFLAQAKRHESGDLAKRDWGDLVGQCEKMLNVTPDAFVVLYARIGITVVPAISVLGQASGPSRDPRASGGCSLRDFLRMHFTCFVGDGFISSTKDDLEEVLARSKARRALLIGAEA